MPVWSNGCLFGQMSAFSMRCDFSEKYHTSSKKCENFYINPQTFIIHSFENRVLECWKLHKVHLVFLVYIRERENTWRSDVFFWFGVLLSEVQSCCILEFRKYQVRDVKRLKDAELNSGLSHYNSGFYITILLVFFYNSAFSISNFCVWKSFILFETILRK